MDVFPLCKFLFIAFVIKCVRTCDICGKRKNIKNVTDVYINPYVQCEEIVHVPPINYYSYPEAYDPPLSPVCLRCALCIAVVEKMNETLIKACKKSVRKSKLYAKDLLRSLCINGFHNFELRRIDSYYIISDNKRASLFVSSHFDGRWGAILSSKCHTYLNVLGETSTYQIWMKNESSLLNAVCRGPGFLRECVGVKDKVLKVCAVVERSWPCGRSSTIMRFRVACP